jgi:hypothetical protein
VEALAAVMLPAGLYEGGGWQREAVLAPLTGRDEALLIDDADGLPLAHRVTALLGRCVRRLGGAATVSEDVVRGLRVGDREALLLHLTRVTLGEQLERIVQCPADGCGEPIEFSLTIADLIRPAPEPEPVYTRTFDLKDGSLPIIFRLPTGDDQETAAVAARMSAEEEGIDRLLRACIQSTDERVAAAMPMLREQLPPIMAELDPVAELWLNLACPGCGHAFAVLFDAATQLAAELSGVRNDIFRQVHTLASAYHWSEAEIMAMPRPRRRRYLHLLEEGNGRSWPTS